MIAILHQWSILNLFIPLRPDAPIEGGWRGQELKFERDLNTVGKII
jgi:hypothetical protein